RSGARRRRCELRTIPEFETERLRLRAWRDEDRVPFAKMNADPRVMEFFPSTMTPEETDAMVDRIESHFEKHGFGPWVVERKDVPGLMGFVGLIQTAFEAHFTPAVEVGWRLAAGHWGHGYATEAARVTVTFGFDELRLPEIVSLTTENNRPSR